MKTLAHDFGCTRTLSSELIAFAKRQLVNATMYKGDERRRKTRRPMMLRVIGVPVDKHFKPIGNPLEMITRDVSTRSIGLFHDQPLSSDRLAIHMVMAGVDVNLVIELTWSEPMGPFYGSGGDYIERLVAFPCQLDGLDNLEPYNNHESAWESV